MSTLPSSILTFFHHFRIIFSTKKTFVKAGLLVTGCLLCKGGRTVCSILRLLGLQGEKAFSSYHHILNRSRWNILKASPILLNQIYKEDEPLRLVIDGHLERRGGSKISARGHYRDPVQSSRKYTVISSGIKWLSVMALKRMVILMTLPENTLIN